MICCQASPIGPVVSQFDWVAIRGVSPLDDDVSREPARDPQDLERLLVSRERPETSTEWRPFMSPTPCLTAVTDG